MAIGWNGDGAARCFDVGNSNLTSLASDL